MQAEIKGTTMPILEVSLGQGEQLVSHHGELAWMTPSIQMSQTTNAGGGGGFMQGLKRVVGGGGLFLTASRALDDHLRGQGTRPHRPGGHRPWDASWCTGTGGCAAPPGSRRASACSRAPRRHVRGEGFMLQKLEARAGRGVELSAS